MITATTALGISSLFYNHRLWVRAARRAKTELQKAIAEAHQLHFLSEIERRADLLPIEVVMERINAAA